MLLETFIFYSIFTSFTVDELCYISNKYQPLNNLAKHQYFHTRDLYLSFISKKIGTLHRKSFSKHPLFTTFLLFLKVSEVCNISSKCWLPNKSANKAFSHKTPYTRPLFQIKICVLHRRIETSTFYNIFTSFDSGWGVLYFK